MNIFEFGKRMEKDGETYYRELAEKCNNKSLKNILMMLADDEVKHYTVLKEMAEGEIPKMSETKILNNVRNIFEEAKESSRDFSFDITQAELYKKAWDLEKKSEEFYLEKSEIAENREQRMMLKRLASEEQQHYWILENVIEFISQPDNWLENAEWHHLEEF